MNSFTHRPALAGLLVAAALTAFGTPPPTSGAPLFATTPPITSPPPSVTAARGDDIGAGITEGRGLSAGAQRDGGLHVGPVVGAGLRVAMGPGGGAGSMEGPPAPHSGYGWPTGGRVAVLQAFDPPTVAWGAGHRGVDLALTAGSSVLAARDGVVVFSGSVAGRPVVSIDHADGIRTTYEPVEACVDAGQVVGSGEVVGTLMAEHRADGMDALHWGARTSRTTYINPLRLIDPPIIRLKPL